MTARKIHLVNGCQFSRNDAARTFIEFQDIPYSDRCFMCTLIFHHTYLFRR